MSAEPASVHPVLRRLAPEDIDAIYEIELAAYPFPWTRGIFSDCIRVGYDCWGLQAGEHLAAYSVHMHTGGECHLLNLCVSPRWQRHGFGRILLDHVVRQSLAQDCFCIFLEVRRSNRPGIKLYRKRGFKVVGERRDYYRAEGGREDAIVMGLDLPEAAGPEPGRSPFTHRSRR